MSKLSIVLQNSSFFISLINFKNNTVELIKDSQMARVSNKNIKLISLISYFSNKNIKLMSMINISSNIFINTI
jgi:exopolyphosphatase/pppGpp-phosphohydrolase